MLTYGGLKQHIVLALGGQPSVVSGVNRDQRIAEIVNQAGNYLFSKSWRFRERTARPISVVAQQDYAPLPGDAEEIISLTCRAGLGWRVEMTSPENMEMLRTSAFPSLSTGSYYAAMARPWAQAGTSTPLIDGSGMPSVRLELFPTPNVTSSDALIIRYRGSWVPVSGESSSMTADVYQIPVPAYAEALLIAYARAFGLAYEDEGLSARLIEIDQGPLFNAAAIKDGIQQRDYGRLLSNRVSPFRRESSAVSSGICGVGAPASSFSNIRWRGVYSPSESYVVGDVVRHGGRSYICVTDTTLVDPPASQWEVMAADGAAGSSGPIGATGPTGPAGTSGAPVDAQYVVMAADGTLSNESVLTAGNHVTVSAASGLVTVDGRINRRKRASLFSDMNAAGDWSNYSSGTGVSNTFSTASLADGNRVGICVHGTGTTATGRAGIGSVATDAVGFGLSEHRLYACVKIPVLSVVTTAEFIVHIGFNDSQSTLGVDALVFQSPRVGLGETTWMACSQNNSAASIIDTFVTHDTNFHSFEIIVNAGGTSATFYIDGNLVATFPTGQIPKITTLPARALGVVCAIIKLNGLTASLMHTDALALDIECSR